MSRLSDRIQEALSLNFDPRLGYDIHAAVQSVKPVLNDDDRDTLIDEALYERAKRASERGKFALKKKTKVQGELPFDLREAYAIDPEGFVKRAEDLFEQEFVRIIEIREKQIIDDRAHLDQLRFAYKSVSPIWRAHPAWTFGQCCEEFLRAAARTKA
jgi:hypothetical protein